MADCTLTFLGTGTSQGVPVIGCECAVCTSSDPRDRRLRSSVYIQTPEACWTIDTGTDFRLQMLREKINRLDAVVYTHSHTDHIMGFDDIRPFCFSGRPMPMYASAETMKNLQRVFEFAFDGNHRFPGYVIPEPHVVQSHFHIGKCELTPLPIIHGIAHVNGYLVKREGRPLFAYLSDCKEVPDPVIERIAGVDTLIIDALRHRLHPTHLSIGEALEISARVKPANTWFTHLCHEISHEETERSLPKNVRRAYDGLKLVF